jgi:CMP-N-acetylneuraminic acid synthetase
MRVFAFVFARGGSKGLPRKNVRILGEKPLMAWSIDTAHSIKEIERIFVSTEDPEISDIGRQYGAEIVERPDYLASDNSPEWLSWQHAVNVAIKRYGTFDVFISLPATSPFRKKNDVVSALQSLDENFDIVLTMKESERNPWFNMVKYNNNKALSTVMENDGTIVRRQDAPKTYDLTTVAYVSKPKFILSNSSMWDGRATGVIVSKRSAVDIDDIEDFYFAEFLLTNKEY